MLTNLTISNVQSIRKLHAELGPITVFYGESDSGKSAIVRALYGLAYNDWPSDFVTAGEQNAGVAVTIGDGEMVVAASKGATANGYAISGAEGAERFDRVGREVPEAVAEVLGWREIELDDGTKIRPSFARQFDEPFLLTMTPSKVAGVLGGLTNIHKLYAAIRQGANRERQKRQSAKEAQARVGEHETQLQALREALAGAQGDLAKVHSRVSKVLEGRGRWEARRVLLSGVQGARQLYEGAKAKADSWRAKLVTMPELGPMVAMMESRKCLLTNVRVATERAQAAVDELSTATTDVQGVIAEVEAFKQETGVCPICQKPW